MYELVQKYIFILRGVAGKDSITSRGSTGARNVAGNCFQEKGGLKVQFVCVSYRYRVLNI